MRTPLLDLDEHFVVLKRGAADQFRSLFFDVPGERIRSILLPALLQGEAAKPHQSLTGLYESVKAVVRVGHNQATVWINLIYSDQVAPDGRKLVTYIQAVHPRSEREASK